MSRIEWRHNRERLIVPAVVFPPPYAANATRSIRVDALLDTGATSTGVRADVVNQLMLERQGKKRVHTANGFLMASEQLLRVGLIAGNYLDPAFEPERTLPYVLEYPIMGFELAAGFPYALLIGMDIIARGDLHIGRDGIAVFDF